MRGLFTSLIAAVLLIGLACPALAAEDIPPCSATEKTEADRQLWLNARDKKLSIDTHLPWGAPAIDKAGHERALVQRDYVVGYDEDLRQPLWAASRLDGSRLDKVKRQDCFRADVRLPRTAASLLTDYEERIFDQGHISPSGDHTTSWISVRNSFPLSNMAPQFCQFNRGVWMILEDLGRKWIGTDRPTYVITGAVFDRDADGRRDADEVAVLMKSTNRNTRVAVASHFYKIFAIVEADGSLSVLTVLLPHDQTDKTGRDAVTYLDEHVATVAEVESLTGLDLFPAFGGRVVEATSLWEFSGPTKATLARGAQCRRTAGARLVGRSYELP